MNASQLNSWDWWVLDCVACAARHDAREAILAHENAKRSRDGVGEYEDDSAALLRDARAYEAFAVFVKDALFNLARWPAWRLRKRGACHENEA
jgi:hypothetical protein